MSKFVKTAALGAGILAFGSAVAMQGVMSAAEAAPFYKGKRVTILIGHSAGGSYGGYATLIANHLGKHLAGNPRVVMVSRRGGGGRKAAKYFFTKAPRDGTMLGLLPDGISHSQLLEPKRAPWDMRKVHYIGRVATSHSVFGVRSDTGVKDVKGLLTTELKAGCSGKTSASSMLPLLVKNLDGAKFQMVCGYAGSGPFMLAMRRGEVNMMALNWGTWLAKLGDKLKTKEFVPLMQVGAERNKLIPDIPLVQDVVGDERSKKIYAWVGLSSDVGRSIFGAPNMPKARVKELRAAWGNLVKDKEFIGAIKKAKFPFDPATGEEIDKLRDKVLAFDPKLVKIAGKAMSEGYKKGCLNCGKRKKKKKKQ